MYDPHDNLHANPPSPARRRFLRRLAGTVGVAASTLAYGHYIGGNELEIDRTTVSLPKWPAGAPPLRIGFLTDLHCDSITAVERTHRAAAMLMAEQPDLVLLGGDYITWSTAKWIGPMAEAIGGLSAPNGVYGVFGNHDWWSGRVSKIKSALAARNIVVLQNQSIQLKAPGHRNLWLVGLDDALTRHAAIQPALRGVPVDATCLLLVHEPDWADVVPPRFALQLSGHSHAGQVRVFGHPLHCPVLGRKYPQGLEQAKNHPVYTSRGVGMMNPKIRIDCPPEVTILTIS